jgi:catalase
VNDISRKDLLVRLAAIGVGLAGIVGLFAYAGGWLSPHTLSPASMIDTFEKVNGRHLGFRRNHAKGVCVSGYFDSNGRGVELSRAAVFPAGRVPVIGRFALAGGLPYVADAPSTVRSLAILFKLPDGEEWRTAMIDIPVFVEDRRGISRSAACFGRGSGNGQVRSGKDDGFPGCPS